MSQTISRAETTILSQADGGGEKLPVNFPHLECVVPIGPKHDILSTTESGLLLFVQTDLRFFPGGEYKPLPWHCD